MIIDKVAACARNRVEGVLLSLGLYSKIMVKYSISAREKSRQFVHVSVQFDNVPENCVIYLPKWRPGRYELGNFAKNVRGFRIFGNSGKPLAFHKVDSSSWQVETDGNTSLKVEYSYYAIDLNAGSTFLSQSQLYVNPVNCCVYIKEQMDDAVEVSLEIPADWIIATGMKKIGHRLEATNFHELADSPFICSAELTYRQYEVNGTVFYVWFNNVKEVPWNKVIEDFKKFTKKQIEKFIEFPVPEYHFLIHGLPAKAYHGVEHQTSTVITLGPVYEIFGELYPELLGVSSHELYHTWNVKAIRPIEMFPYDYQRENYSKLGYLCEGVTTYMGDLMLLKSGVFSLSDYLREMKSQLQKHFDNFGRFNYSVADSSFDTWLDGYAPGAPGRKVSIYTEGCLLAFVSDIYIRRKTGNKLGLDEAMKRLYYNFALQGKGVSEADYRELLVSLGGEEIHTLLDEHCYGTRPFESILTDAFEYLGIEFLHKPAASYSASRCGLKALGEKNTVTAIYPGSTADMGELQIGDSILAVNGCEVNNDLDKWLKYFDDETKVLTVQRHGLITEIQLPEVQRHFFLEYDLKPVGNPTHEQKKALEHWMK